MKITIEGTTGEGKSTIAALISKALRDEGITKVTVKDEELLSSFYDAGRQRGRLGWIAMKGTPFVIETVQTRRPEPVCS